VQQYQTKLHAGQTTASHFSFFVTKQKNLTVTMPKFRNNSRTHKLACQYASCCTRHWNRWTASFMHSCDSCIRRL